MNKAIELLLDAFRDYVEKTLGRSSRVAGEYRQIAQDFITYLERLYGRWRWFQQLRNTKAALDFLAQHADLKPSTQKGKRAATEAFQAYLRQYGQLEWIIAWARIQQQRAIVILLVALVTVGIFIASLFGWTPQHAVEEVAKNYFPSATPTITLTPTATATLTLTPSLTPTLTPTPALFSSPAISEVINGGIPGYSKQSTMVRDSQGRLTLFVQDNPKTNALGYIQSSDGGKTWSKLVGLDQLNGGPELSAAIDSADNIHVVWGRWDGGDVKYAMLSQNSWTPTQTIGTGAFARDISVDSANHPHIVWTSTDLSYETYTGQKWIGPTSIASGGWHPDIHLDANDNLLLFLNDGNFYPTPGVSVYAIDYISGSRNIVKVSTSPFWSGGATAALDSQETIYLVWIGASSQQGGADQIFFSRLVNGSWQQPFSIGDVNQSAGQTGKESPSVGFDANDVFYVFWKGLDDKNRPVIFTRALGTENSKVQRVTTGWSPIITLRAPNASNISWPSVADVRPASRVVGVDVVWGATVGTISVIEYSHVTYP